jgi:hypothetical protein
MRKTYADGFVIVRDSLDDSPAVYLTQAGDWSPESDRLRNFVSYQDARQWIRARPMGYWLSGLDTAAAGPARVISARAAGLVSSHA